MAIGTPVNQGNASSASTPSSLAITNLATINTHDIIIVWHYANSLVGGANSCTDSASNTYIKAQAQVGSGVFNEMWLCPDATGFASGGSITFPSFQSNVLRQGMTAVSVSGMVNGAGVYDPHTGVQAIATSTSCASTAMNGMAAAQMLMFHVFNAGTNPGTYTPGTGFTQVGGSGTNAWVIPSYQILSSVNPGLAMAPSWVSSVSNCVRSYGFVGIPAANTSRQAQMSLMDVGA